ncbi:DUF1735 domain-containing protein [Flammeovirga aprica]|uniref:DUF1735 domain-containing protein n=1 Tax=Flammeovirga aprica JL-4 TaxID=694437 RepID=A0A7X9RYT3_9BACT|nr:DUF1735 domain-containing protein [Flammeovirga aprica]NME71213.1 DUF1735 domain-containing protein [Flammeovirga aprica JL-4]
MKRLLYTFIAAFFLLTSCESYNNYLTDYDYSSVYFPYQKPVRTVIAGEGLQFKMGVVLGGKRENNKTEVVKYAIDSTLLEGTAFEMLPSEYYTLSNENEMWIQEGEFNGLIDVVLDSSKFLQDPNSLIRNYALPIRILSSTTDSVLTGDELKGVAPMDYMIPVIKYIHTLDAVWYHHGVDSAFNASGDLQDVTVNSDKDMVNNVVWNLSTVGATEVITNGLSGIRFTSRLHLNMNFDDGIIDLKSASDSEIQDVENIASRYVKQDQKVYLKYKYSLNDQTHIVTDTLTFRNKELSLELWD